jgi:hypothetical protein
MFVNCGDIDLSPLPSGAVVFLDRILLQRIGCPRVTLVLENRERLSERFATDGHCFLEQLLLRFLRQAAPQLARRSAQGRSGGRLSLK